MTLCDDISNSVCRGERMPDVQLTLVFREVKDEGDVYFVAECLEIPGCISQGATQEQAERNIDDAIKSCLMVMYSDALKRLMDSPYERDLRGISAQRRLILSQPLPELQPA
jgi:predicted RNase H-like HicB family nuclease